MHAVQNVAQKLHILSKIGLCMLKICIYLINIQLRRDISRGVGVQKMLRKRIQLCPAWKRCLTRIRSSKSETVAQLGKTALKLKHCNFCALKKSLVKESEIPDVCLARGGKTLSYNIIGEPVPIFPSFKLKKWRISAY